MKTVLSLFCEEFDAVIRPLLEPLRHTAEILGRTDAQLPVRTILPQLREIEHHLDTLTSKVAEQQAYVLIFGPLKSGKSTLMNAISAAYVSEVTTLPAYPCMVYLTGAEQRSYVVSRYSGERETVLGTDAMHTLMQQAHIELARAIREVERAGESFDPASHMPRAIRRVDVKVPAPDLAGSSAVLVDTPGLYTRMKFGYDQMTRDFRDSASCAIFVVKTDNLFLEQVFDEFGDLLELFSRIFLLVNIDSNKRDLLPDGQLRLSLEGSEPQRILDAFENLAMSAPLKAASEEGRLGIYAVDLLRAASLRLAATHEGGQAQGVLYEDAEESADGAGGDFDRFLGDLTDYLNSTDYLVAFLGDSLRQSERLLTELQRIFDLDVVRKLDEQVAGLSAQLEHCHSVETAVERLSAFAWKQSFDQLGEDLRSITDGRLSNRRDETQQTVSRAVDAWYAGDGSFQALLDQNVLPLLRDVREDLARTARSVLETVAANDSAGAELPHAMRQDMVTVALGLADQGRSSVQAVDAIVAEDAVQLAVSTGDIPVRRGLLDWLLFRSRAAIRRRLFGPPDAPTRAVFVQVKQRRIGEKGRDDLRTALLADLNRFFNDELTRLSHRMLEAYVGHVQAGVAEGLDARRRDNTAQAERVEQRLAALRQVLVSSVHLQSVLTSCRDGITAVAARFGQTEPTELIAPAEAPPVQEV